MPYIILIFVSRKPGTTPSSFRTHWEESHVPLIKSLTGADFPLSHTRHYISRSENAEGGGGPANPNFPATVFAGTQEDFDYDGFAMLTFENEAAFQVFYGKASAPEAAKKIADDEDKFADRGKLKIVRVGEVTSTARD